MREIEKHRVGSTYAHVSDDECDKKGTINLISAQTL